MRKLLVVLAFCGSASLLAAQSQVPDTASKKVKGNKVGSPPRTADTFTVWLKPGSDQVYPESGVEVLPAFLSGPTLVYPDLLRQAGVQGRVIVQAIIDTMGRAEPWSVKIIESPNEGFNEPARNYILGALFRAARIHARAVRVLVNVPIDYSIRPKRR